MTDIDYNSLHGVEGYKAAFPHALSGLSEQRLRSVVEAVHSGVLDGDEPTESDVAALAARTPGPVTHTEANELAAQIFNRRGEHHTASETPSGYSHKPSN